MGSSGRWRWRSRQPRWWCGFWRWRCCQQSDSRLDRCRWRHAGLLPRAAAHRQGVGGGAAAKEGLCQVGGAILGDGAAGQGVAESGGGDGRGEGADIQHPQVAGILACLQRQIGTVIYNIHFVRDVCCRDAEVALRWIV